MGADEGRLKIRRRVEMRFNFMRPSSKLGQPPPLKMLQSIYGNLEMFSLRKTLCLQNHRIKKSFVGEGFGSYEDKDFERHTQTQTLRLSILFVPTGGKNHFIPLQDPSASEQMPGRGTLYG